MLIFNTARAGRKAGGGRGEAGDSRRKGREKRSQCRGGEEEKTGEKEVLKG